MVNNIVKEIVSDITLVIAIIFFVLVKKNKIQPIVVIIFGGIGLISNLWLIIFAHVIHYMQYVSILWCILIIIMGIKITRDEKMSKGHKTNT